MEWYCLHFLSGHSLESTPISSAFFLLLKTALLNITNMIKSTWIRHGFVLFKFSLLFDTFFATSWNIFTWRSGHYYLLFFFRRYFSLFFSLFCWSLLICLTIKCWNTQEFSLYTHLYVYSFSRSYNSVAWLYHLYTDNSQIYISDLDFSLDIHICILDCLFGVSIWISSRYL